MKLGEVFRFEAGQQLRRFSTWLYLLVLLGFTLQLAVEAYAAKARAGGYLFNSPYILAELTLLGSLVSLLLLPGITGDAAARDVQVRMHPLLYTTPVGKGTYLRGRFLAALAVHALLLLAVPLAIGLASLAPSVEAELVGPFRASAYLAPYLVFALPNACIAAALQFSLAALHRRAVVAYLGSAILLAASVLSWQFLAARLGQWELAKLTDPLGLTLMSELMRETTPFQKDTLAIGLQGSLLVNRLVWLAFAAAVLAATHLRFRFAHHAGVDGRRGGTVRAGAGAIGAVEEAAPKPARVPRVRGTFARAGHARQALAIAGESFRMIVTGWGGLALAAFVALLVLTGSLAMRYMGVPLVPTTQQMTTFLASPLTNIRDLPWLVVPLLIVLYAGELVWREREAGMSDIADASPLPDWVPFLGKFLGLGLVLVALQASLVAAGVVVQARLGHPEFELGLYARILFGLLLVDYLLFALLAMVVHVVVDQKYVAHAVVLVAFAFMAYAPALGIEHNLLVYGSDPGWEYSDLRGFGPFLGPWLWFKLYWGAWALLLAVAARLLWVRGRESGLGWRATLARRRFTRSAAGATAVAAGLVALLGGFVFYNTNVLNQHRTAADALEVRAEYERRYGRYGGIPQPVVTGTRLQVEIHPRRREVGIRGAYVLENRTGVAIDSLHVLTSYRVATPRLEPDRPARLAHSDEALGHRIFALETPLQPGDSLRLAFEVEFEPRGFPSRGVDASVAENGTYFDAQAWLPAVGYQPELEVANAGDRRAHGLPPRPSVRPVSDGAARLDLGGQRTRTRFEAVVGTEEGQLAVAPGRLVRSWTENGRRYFHYAADAPIRRDFAIYSAAYAVRRGRWTDPAPGSARTVDIEVVHDPAHAWNVDRMLRSVHASLDHFAARYGPYPHGQIRLVEHAGPGENTLHSAPINVSYQEGFSLLRPQEDPRQIDFPFAIIAHEVAHQWWGNQVTPAPVEGGALVTESLAWYSAFGIVEESYGPDHLRRLLAMLREAYLTPHSRGSVPLLRANDWLHAYRKGPFAMYALREYVGDERVGTALRRLMEKHGSGAPPLATSLDLYRELQAVTPDSLRTLLHDLFAANTYWELTAREAKAEPTPDGQWRVTLDVWARKVVVDTAGAETERPMDDLVEVGVFAATGKGAAGEPLYLRKHRIRAGEQRLTVTVPRRPARAAVDPRSLLVEVDGDDNAAPVAVAPRGRGGARSGS